MNAFASPKKNGQEIILYEQYVQMNIDGVEKTISIGEFKTILDKIMDTEAVIEPLILPRNVMVFGKTSNTIQLNTYWPSVKVTLQFTVDRGLKPRPYEVQLPNIILYYVLTLNSAGTYGVACKYFSTDKAPGELGFSTELNFIKEINQAKGIYPLALPNMYGDGKACYGGNSMPNGLKTDLRGLDWYYLFLRETPFNSDLSIPGVKRNLRLPKDFMNFLVTKQSYPFTELFE